MGRWEEIDVASASAVSAGWGTKGFVEFAVERDAAVAAFSRACMNDQMVEKGLSLCRRAKRSRDEVGEGAGRDARPACVSTLSFVFDEQFPSNYTWAPLRRVGRIYLLGEKRSCGRTSDISGGETA